MQKIFNKIAKIPFKYLFSLGTIGVGLVMLIKDVTLFFSLTREH